MAQDNQRVYEIAKELGLSNKEVLEKLNKQNKSRASNLLKEF